MHDLHVPRMKPAARNTWEVRDTLLGSQEETRRLTFELPGPCIIVGCHVSVIPISSADLFVPTTETVLALLEIDNLRDYTSSRDRTQGQTTVGTNAEQLVTLASLDTQFRDLNIDAASGRPVLACTFRWKHWTGAAIYENAICSIAWFVEPKG